MDIARIKDDTSTVIYGVEVNTYERPVATNYYTPQYYNNNRALSRLVVDTPFTTKNTISYGLIVYARDTKRWIVIQRKHSVEFLLFFKGSYRPAHLPILLSRITSGEGAIIRDCIEKGPDTFTRFYLDELGLPVENLDNACIRMAESRLVTIKLLNKLNLENNKLSWSWPKGRLCYSTQNSIRETPFDCACREFVEEVEVQLPTSVFISENYISDVIKTIGCHNIESRYWIYVIEHEMNLVPPESHPEVSDRMWISAEDSRVLFNNPDIVEQALEFLP